MENTAGPNEIKIQIVCWNLPGSRSEERTGVRLGIQKGQIVVDDVGADTSSVTFTAALKVVQDREKGTVNFLGPFAQGTTQERFIYLCWGERKNGMWEGFRRAKLPISPLGSEVVEKALSTGQPLKVVIDMTDAKGEPLCASIKPDKAVWQL